MRRFVAVVLLAVIAIALPASAAGPLLHEYIEPLPSEDIALGSTTLDGTMPAAIETPSGDVVPAPSPRRDRAPQEKAYSGSTPNSLDATYQIDSDTRRPDRVGYDDPFTPAVTPFKRLFAYDAVSDDLELIVGDPELRPLSVGGRVDPGDDQFFGDMFVDVDKDVPVRIPSVGPGARVLSAHVDPPGEFELLHDAADNWFLRMDRRARVRLVVQLAVRRDVFGSPFASVPWSVLVERAALLPRSAKSTAQSVLEHIGVSQELTPRDALTQLVGYFRAFQPSTERPSSNGLALYQDLAISQKGVCRHRAYAFVITALELGIPARFVRNEAHAWVEVFDGSIWHRVDLGGAAGHMDAPLEEGSTVHQPPDDPYAWPQGSESGLDMAQASLPTSGGQPGGSGQGSGSSSLTAPAPTGSGKAPGDDPLAPPDDPAEEDPSGRPPATVELELSARESFYRGAPLAVAGRVMADGDPCAYARVDVSIVSGTDDGVARKIGSLATNEEGRYSGEVVIPLDTDVGEYEVVVSTPGHARCGAGEAR